VLGIAPQCVKLVAVDDRDSAVLLTELALRVVGDDRHRAPAHGARDLERHAAEAAGRSPHEDDVAGSTTWGGQPMSIR